MIAEFTWRNGVSAKHIDPLFDELSTKVQLPSPLVMLSLDGSHAYLHDRISRIPGSQLFGTPDVGITYRH